MITFNSFNLSRLLSPQVAPVCLGGEPRGSNAFLNFFDHDKRGAGLLRVTGRSRACGHGFLSLSASTKTQSSGQNSHNQNCFYKFQIISPPFAASCSTRSGSYGSNVSLPWFGCMIGKILARTLQLATRNLIGNSCLNYDRRAFIHEIEQFDYIRVPHSNAAAAVGAADLVLVFRTVDVDKTVACIGILLVQSVEP